MTPDHRLIGETGQPLVNYKATYPRSHIFAGSPVLSMTEVRPDPELLFPVDITAAPNAVTDLNNLTIPKKLRTRSTQRNDL